MKQLSVELLTMSGFAHLFPLIHDPLLAPIVPLLNRSIVPSLPLPANYFYRRERRRHHNQQGTIAASAASYGGSGGARDHSDGCDHDDGHDVLLSAVAQSAARGDGGT